MEYVKKYSNWFRLNRKVTGETLALFITAEKYLNVAIYQLNRASESTPAELMFRDIHSYLAFISVVFKSLQSIGQFNPSDTKLTQYIQNLDDPSYPKNLIAAKHARNFVEHINETIENVAGKGHPIDSAYSSASLTLPLTLLIDDTFVYYSWTWIDKKKGERQYHIEEIPLHRTLDNIKEAYEMIFEILNSRQEKANYLATSGGFNFISDMIVKNSLGSVEEIIDGITGNSIGSILVDNVNVSCDYRHQVGTFSLKK